MTFEDQLKAVREMFPAVHAEVRRMSADVSALEARESMLIDQVSKCETETARLEAEVERLRLIISQQAKANGKLAEENEVLRGVFGVETAICAEVERLRADNSRLIMENVGREELKAEVAKLEAENAELRSGYALQTSAVARGLAHCERECKTLKEENAELRAGLVADHMGQQTPQQLLELWRVTHKALQRANDSVEALKATLAWFEGWATIVSVVTARFMVARGSGSEVIDAVNDLIMWEHEHPRPGSERP